MIACFVASQFQMHLTHSHSTAIYKVFSTSLIFYWLLSMQDLVALVFDRARRCKRAFIELEPSGNGNNRRNCNFWKRAGLSCLRNTKLIHPLQVIQGSCWEARELRSSED